MYAERKAMGDEWLLRVDIPKMTFKARANHINGRSTRLVTPDYFF